MVFLCWTRPSSQDHKACINKSGGFNHDTKFRGGTAKPMSCLQQDKQLTNDGFSLNHARVLVGSGLDTFKKGKTALQNWRHFGLNWTFVDPKTPIQSGVKFCTCVKEFVPWLMMPLQVAYVNENRNSKKLMASFGFGSGTLQGHLLVEEEEPLKVRLLTTLTELQIQRRHKKLPKVLNLLDFGVSEIGKFYRTQSYALSEGSSCEFSVISKLAILSSNPTRTASADSYTAMAIYNRGKLCLLKSGEEEWTPIDMQYSDYYSDVIKYKGEFYAVTSNGSAIAVDSFLEVTEIASPIREGGGGGHHKHLVDSFGDLLLVDIHLPLEHPVGDQFRVYKLDEEERKWVQMRSLGDRALFVDTHCSFSVSARDFIGCKGNCIYYADKCLWTYRSVFDLEDGSLQQLHLDSD